MRIPTSRFDTAAMTRTLLAVAAVVGLLAPEVDAAPVPTCDAQAGCLRLDVTYNDDGSICDATGSCSYTACMTLNTNRASCDRNGVAIVHECDMSQDDTCPYNGNTWDPDETLSPIMSVQCQTGGPGETVSFAYMDRAAGVNGGGCQTGNGGTYDLDPTAAGVEQATCAPTTEETCSGPDNIGVECLWTVTLPACPVCPDGSDSCADPHIAGLRGQHIFWYGDDGEWYSLLADTQEEVYVNVRVTSPLPDFPWRQDMTGFSIVSHGHSVVVEVKDPYTVDTQGCPDDVYPCLTDGAIRITVDGEEAHDLLGPVDDVALLGGLTWSASNLPTECQHFNRRHTLARHAPAVDRRSLRDESFVSWLLEFEDMVTSDWCHDYLVEDDPFTSQSPYTVFRINTPSMTLRFALGVDHHEAGRPSRDGRTIPSYEMWRTDIGVDELPVKQDLLSGLLGETARPVVQAGKVMMRGKRAMRGDADDYKVSGPTGVDFNLLHRLGQASP